ncbi:MAG TPA: molybdopterin-dependent oxidoreductase [Thermoanaerobaculia bacterium]|jgi:DMSO/TMAO reductase YedYZ molybdopterin-dependent catalytic subunit|nr:molybdopterin-dependent oxidoreductase [Thermoanaerobaculia bacterium]
MLKILIPALLLFAEVPAPTATPPVPGPPVLEVAGSPAPLKLTPDLLHRLPRKQVSIPASEHGGAASFEGVRLRDLLSEAKVPAGTDIRGQFLSWVVIVDAADGYRAVFALAELDPAFTDRLVLLADTRDGKPLPPNEAPLRLVVPDEKRPARWVRQITHLTVGPVSAKKP